jgi:hypothetical protein
MQLAEAQVVSEKFSLGAATEEVKATQEQSPDSNSMGVGASKVRGGRDLRGKDPSLGVIRNNGVEGYEHSEVPSALQVAPQIRA